MFSRIMQPSCHSWETWFDWNAPDVSTCLLLLDFSFPPQFTVSFSPSCQSCLSSCGTNLWWQLQKALKWIYCFTTDTQVYFMVNISTKTRIFIPLGQRSLVKMKSLDLDRLRLLFGALQRKGKVISKKQKHHQTTFLLIRSYDKIIFLYPCLKYTSSPFHSQLPSRKQCPPNYV